MLRNPKYVPVFALAATFIIPKDTFVTGIRSKMDLDSDLFGDAFSNDDFFSGKNKKLGFGFSEDSLFDDDGFFSSNIGKSSYENPSSSTSTSWSTSTSTTYSASTGPDG